MLIVCATPLCHHISSVLQCIWFYIRFLHWALFPGLPSAALIKPRLRSDGPDKKEAAGPRSPIRP